MRISLFLIPLLLLLASCAGRPDAVIDPPVVIGTSVGDQAPDFTLPDTSGAPVSLAKYRGKVVLLDFWASWCGPCLVKLPDVRSIWEKYRDRDFVILSVSVDYTTAAWKAFIAKEHLDWVHVYDDQKSLYGAIARYNVGGIPDMYLIDREGKVASSRMYTGRSEMEAAIEAALK
jgi:peroxiredoxin